MPVVKESYSSGPERLQTIRKNVVNGTEYNTSEFWNLPLPAVTKSQTGFRSGPLSQEEILGKDGHTWAAANKRIAAGDGVFRPRKARAFMVNDRDYLCTKRTSGETRSTFEYVVNHGTTDSRVDSASVQGFIRLNDPPLSLFPSGLPSVSYTSSIAGQRMRQSTPTAPEIDLALVLAELRDFPGLVRNVLSLPRAWTSAREGAGQYLGAVFGFMPTGSDVMTLAEIAARSHEKVAAFERHANRQLRRSRVDTLYEDTRIHELDYPTVNSQGDYTMSGGWRFQAKGIHAFAGNVSNVRYAPHLTLAVELSRVVRTFCTFEYFIPNPLGLNTRMKEYKKKFEKLLGSGLTPGLLYDLTPFSWLIDYFLDVGGLLRYQNEVANNGVTASRAGHTLVERVDATLFLSGYNFYPGTSSTVSRKTTAYGSSTYSRETVRRRKGNPYSMSPSWDLTTQQWAIVGALGLARSPGVPIQRG